MIIMLIMLLMIMINHDHDHDHGDGDDDDDDDHAWPVSPLFVYSLLLHVTPFLPPRGRACVFCFFTYAPSICLSACPAAFFPSFLFVFFCYVCGRYTRRVPRSA